MKIDAIWQAENQQQIFRMMLEAMSRPGSVQDLSVVVNGSCAGKAALATLLDAEVKLADPHSLLEDTDWPLMQAVQSEPTKADYIYCDGGKRPDFEPRIGTLSSPDESATLIINVASLAGETLSLSLQGPGIEDRCCVSIDGMNTNWLDARNNWVSAFPLGVDMFFVDEHSLIGLPRTTRVEVLS